MSDSKLPNLWVWMNMTHGVFARAERPERDFPLVMFEYIPASRIRELVEKWRRMPMTHGSSLVDETQSSP